MIDNRGLLRVISLALIRGSGDLQPRHAQMVGDLGFAIQNTAQLSSGRIVPRLAQSNNKSVTPFIPRERPNVEHYCW